MAQSSTSALQSPATPSRQLGVARGTRRTPASRTKKPYMRPTQTGGHELHSDYQKQGSPGFLKGMRSLVSRLWGTSLKPSRRTAMGATTASKAEMGSLRNAGEKMPAVARAENANNTKLPGSFSAATVSGASAGLAATAAACEGSVDGSSDYETSAVVGRAATAAGRVRAQRPTAESLFAPSPFAYNKRLVAATPSVANLRDVVRVRADADEQQRTRGSTARINAGLDRRQSNIQLSTPLNGDSKEHLDATFSRYVSPSNARRLLSTLGSLNTPILDARSRSAGTPATVSSSTTRRIAEPSAVSGDRATPMPLRRLPVSLLGLNDTANKALYPSLGDSTEALDTSALRRSGSNRGARKQHAAAPSLAKTIQLQQARRAAADRLVRSKTANPRTTGSDAETYVSSYSFHGGDRSDVSVAGRVHQRDDDEDEEMDDQLPKKRRRGASDGEAGAIRDVADYSAPESVSRQRVGRLKHLGGRRVMRTHRAASAADEGITWRFSARLDPVSDDNSSSSSEDEDREALSAKVPADRIRGGELIGLSLRQTVSASSAGGMGGVAAVSVRSTGFGSSRTPIPIFSEAEQPSKPAFSASENFSVPEQSASLTAKSQPTIEPSVSVASAPSLGTTAPTATNVEDDTHKQKLLFTTAPTSKRRADENDASMKPTTSDVPSFSLGGLSTSKRRADEDDESAKDQASKPALPAASSFSFGSSLAKSDAGKGDVVASETSSKPANPTAPSFSFSGFSASKPVSDSNSPEPKGATSIPSASTGPSFSSGGFSVPKSDVEEGTKSINDVASKPTASAVPAFNFGGSFGKSDAGKSGTSVSEATSKPAASTIPAFGFGGVSTSKTSSDDKVPEDSATQKPAASAAPAFSFGGFGSSKPDTNKPTDTTASQPAASAAPTFSFGAFGASKPSTSVGAAKDLTPQPAASGFSFSTTKPESGTKVSVDLSKPSLNFGTTASTTLNGSLQADTEPKPTFKFDLGSTGAGAGIAAEKRDGADVGAKPAFTFGSGSNSTGAFSSAQAPVFGASGKTSDAAPSSGFSFTKPAGTVGSSGSFSFANGSSFAAPAKTLDLTKAASKSAGTPPKSVAGSGAFGFGASNALQASDSMDSSPSFKPASAPNQMPAKPASFNFSSLNTPSASSFNSANVPTPAAPSFGSAASLAAPSFGAPAATPSSFNFGAASSQTATPSTATFNFGAKSAAPQPSAGFGNASAQSVGGFGGASAQPTTGFGSTSTQPTTGFGSTSAQPATGFGGTSTQPSTGFGGTAAQPVIGFGASSTQFGAGSAPGAAASHGFGAASSSAAPSAFGFPSNASTGFGGSSSAGFPPPSAGFGSASGSGFGTPVATPSTSTVPGSSAAQFNFGQSQPAASSSFQFGSNTAATSTPAVPFSFSSNTAPQAPSQTGSFQFTAGVAQPSNAGLGGTSVSRIAGGSNASTSSHGRRIARPRPRRLH